MYRLSSTQIDMLSGFAYDEDILPKTKVNVIDTSPEGNYDRDSAITNVIRRASGNIKTFLGTCAQDSALSEDSAAIYKRSLKLKNGSSVIFSKQFNNFTCTLNLAINWAFETDDKFAIVFFQGNSMAYFRMQDFTSAALSGQFNAITPIIILGMSTPAPVTNRPWVMSQYNFKGIGKLAYAPLSVLGGTYGYMDTYHLLRIRSGGVSSYYTPTPTTFSNFINSSVIAPSLRSPSLYAEDNIIYTSGSLFRLTSDGLERVGDAAPETYRPLGIGPGGVSLEWEEFGPQTMYLLVGPTRVAGQRDFYPILSQEYNLNSPIDFMSSLALSELSNLYNDPYPSFDYNLGSGIATTWGGSPSFVDSTGFANSGEEYPSPPYPGGVSTAASRSGSAALTLLTLKYEMVDGYDVISFLPISAYESWRISDTWSAPPPPAVTLWKQGETFTSSRQVVCDGDVISEADMTFGYTLSDYYSSPPPGLWNFGVSQNDEITVGVFPPNMLYENNASIKVAYTKNIEITDYSAGQTSVGGGRAYYNSYSTSQFYQLPTGEIVTMFSYSQGDSHFDDGALLVGLENNTEYPSPTYGGLTGWLHVSNGKIVIQGYVVIHDYSGWVYTIEDLKVIKERYLFANGKNYNILPDLAAAIKCAPEEINGILLDCPPL